MDRPSSRRSVRATAVSAAYGSSSPKSAAFAIFEDACVDRGVFDHGGIVQGRHIRHTALRMTPVKIGAEQAELFFACDRVFDRSDQVLVELSDPPERLRFDKLIDQDSDRNTR